MATRDEGGNPFAKYVSSQPEENPFARYVAPQEEGAEPQQAENPFAKYVAPKEEAAPVAKKEEPQSEGLVSDMFEGVKGLFGQSKYQEKVPEGEKNWAEKQLGYLGTDVQIGLKNTQFAFENLANAEKLGLTENRIQNRLQKYGSLEQMPEEEKAAQLKDEEHAASFLQRFSEQGKDIQQIKDVYGQRDAAKRYSAMRQSPEYQQADTLSQMGMIGQQFLRDPLGMLATTIVDTGLQSLPTSLGVAATAVLARAGMMSPTAAAVVGGGASGMSEFGNQYADLRAQGKSHEDAWHEAGVKSGVIGAFDAASFRSAGKAADEVMGAISQGAKSGIFGKVAKETGRQAAYGGAGEALGSAAIGQPIDPAAVLDEMMGEIVGAPAEAVSTMQQRRPTPTAKVLPTPDEAAKAKGFLQASQEIPGTPARIPTPTPEAAPTDPVAKRAAELETQYGIHAEDALAIARDEVKEAESARQVEPRTGEPSVPVYPEPSGAVPGAAPTEGAGVGRVSAPAGVPTGREGTQPSSLEIAQGAVAAAEQDVKDATPEEKPRALAELQAAKSYEAKVVQAEAVTPPTAAPEPTAVAPAPAPAPQVQAEATPEATPTEALPAAEQPAEAVLPAEEAAKVEETLTAAEAEPAVTGESEPVLARTGKRGRPVTLTPEQRAERLAQQQQSAGASRDAGRKMERLAAYIAEPFDGTMYDTDAAAAEAQRIFEANKNVALEEAVDMVNNPSHRKNKAGRAARALLDSLPEQQRNKIEANYKYKKEHNLPIGRQATKPAQVRASTALELSQSTNGSQNDVYSGFNTAQQAISWIGRTGNAFEKALAQRILPFLKGVKLVVVTDINQVPEGQRAEFRNAHGLYYNTRSTGPVIFLSAKTGINNTTFLHEALHGATYSKIESYYNAVDANRAVDPRLRGAIEDLHSIMAHAGIHFEKLLTDYSEGNISDPKTLQQIHNMLAFADANAFEDLHEFVAYGMSHPVFQEFLASVPGQVTGIKGGLRDGLTRFVQAIRKMFNMDESTQSALQDLIIVSDALLSAPTQQNIMEGGKAAKVAPEVTEEGERAEELMRGFNGKPATAKTNFLKRTAQRFDNVWQDLRKSQKQNNSWTAAIFGKMQNIASFDRAFNNRLWNEFKRLEKEGIMTMQAAKDAALRISISQAVHRGNLANAIIDAGNYHYNPTTNRWTAVQAEENMLKMEGIIKSLATRLGVDPNRAREIMGAAYEANRLNSFIEQATAAQNVLATVKTEIATLKKNRKRTKAQDRELRTKESVAKALETRIEELAMKGQHKTEEEVAKGMELYNAYPEIAEGARVWNTMRERVINLMVDTGVWSRRKAEAYLDDAAYVPFFRDMQEESLSGPRVMSGGIRESMTEHKMKGSMREVQDPISNMFQWMQWSIARSISNQQLQVMVDQYKAVLPDEVHEGGGTGEQTFIIYREGLPYKYSVADPAIAQAFTGMETVFFPGVGAAAKVSNAFRHFITRIPVFPVGQLFMDSWTVMSTSGVKHPFALLKEIGVEVLRTARHTSETRAMLKRSGILETRQYAALSEEEAIARHLNLHEPSMWHKTMNFLDRFAAASDNVLRQGVYNQSIKEGLSHEAAMERAAEIVNFRRQSGNPAVRFMSRIVPFFNAYLQVLDVAVRTVSGKSISPTERTAALAALVSTSAKIAVLSFLYSALVGDDEDYKRKSRVVRDRMFMVPGTGGLGVPIRTDVFALPKIIGEYGYQIIADKGYTDSKMLKDAVKRALLNTVSPPSEGVPQLVRPLIEVKTNYDFFQDRPIVSPGMENIEPQYQYNKNTSEMAKAIGAFGNFSPAKIDHLIRGYFGSVGTLTMIATNDLIASMRGTPPAPEKRLIDYVTAVPGMSGFVSKPENTAAMSDFYEMYKEVSVANNTLSKLKQRPEEYAAYLEKNKELISYKHMVNTLHNQLTKLSQREQKVRAYPESVMSAADKRKEIDAINQQRDAYHARILALRQQLYK